MIATFLGFPASNKRLYVCFKNKVTLHSGNYCECKGIDFPATRVVFEYHASCFHSFVFVVNKMTIKHQ